MQRILKFKLGIGFILLFLSVNLFSQGNETDFDPSIKGHNIGLAIEKSAQSTFKWVQISDDKWTCTNTMTGKDQGTFTQTGRGEWSVFLINDNTGRDFQIDVWKKKVFDRSTGLETYGELIQIGLRPSSSPTPNLGSGTDGWSAYTPPSGYFLIKNESNGQVFDVAGSETAVGTNVVIYSNYETKNQKFRFISKGGDYYAIETALKSNIFLSIHESGKSDNTNVKLNNPVGNNQHFKLEKNASGQVRFVSKLGSDLYLGMDDSGDNLVIRKGDKGDKTSFTLVQTTIEGKNDDSTEDNSNGWSAYTPASGYFLIKNESNGQVFDVAGSETAVGTNVVIYSNYETKNQKFRFISKGGDYYAIETALKSNIFLSIHESGKSDNTNVKLNNPVGNNQHFKLEKNASGQVRFVSKLGSDLYLGMDDSGDNLVIRKGDKGDKTSFTLVQTTVETENNDQVGGGNNNPESGVGTGKVMFKNMASTFVVTITKVGDASFEKTIAPSGTVSVNARPGDVFMFTTNSDGFEGLPYTVSTLGITHKVVIGSRYNTGKGQKLPNVKASRHSFDIKKVDPVFIDYTKSQAITDVKGKTIGYGGMRKEIFEKLKIQDIDWNNNDGDYATKNHFSYDMLMEARGSEETKMFYSSSAYEKSFSANVGADTPKGGGSASFSYTSSNSNSSTNIYTYSRTKVRAYSVSLKKEYIALTKEFKDAVRALPKSYSASAYRNFISQWGTHYPLSTTYGGVQVASYKFKAKDVMSSESMAIGIKANMKKASAGGGYSSSKEYRETQENSKGIYRSKGGTGKGDGFTVTKDDAVPIEIDLKRLHELLLADYFNDGTSDAELSQRKANLKRAITDYIGSPTDSGRSLKPRMYKMTDVKWTATRGESDFNVYGKLWASFWKKSSSGKDKKFEGTTIWSRTDASGSRVRAMTNDSYGVGSLTFTVYPENGRMDLSDYYAKVSSELSDWNASSSNETPGYRNRKFSLKDASTMPQMMSYDIGFPREETRIRVSATIQEIDLGFDN